MACRRRVEPRAGDHVRMLGGYSFRLWQRQEQKSAPDEQVLISGKEDSVVDPSARNSRCTSAEVHGTVPLRRSTQKSMCATLEAAHAESMPCGETATYGVLKHSPMGRRRARVTWRTRRCLDVAISRAEETTEYRCRRHNESESSDESF